MKKPEQKIPKPKKDVKVDNKVDELRNKKLKLANKFKDDVLKKYKDIVKAVVVFGSITRGDFHEKSDIDMLVIIDDIMARFTPEMKDAFDDKLHEIAKSISE